MLRASVIFLCALGVMSVGHATEEDANAYPRGAPSGAHAQLGPLPIPLWLLQGKGPLSKAPLTGRCEAILSEGSNITSPCENVELSLLDGHDKEIEKTHTTRGRFAFSKVARQGYKIRSQSKLFVMRTPASVDPGKEFVVTLIRK